MEMNEIRQKIEAILFVAGEPMNVKKIAELVDCSEKEIQEGAALLKEKYSSPESGIYLLKHDSGLQLVTKPETSPVIEKLVKKETRGDLTPAALETLSLISYLSPISRYSIEYIRGVNSSFTLRNLLIRGLVERIPHPKKNNAYLYRPTSDLLRYLGISSKEDLPEFSKYQELKKNMENEQLG